MRTILLGIGTAIVLAVAPAATLGQELTAEVRTWAGEAWRLGQPQLERVSTNVLEDDPAATAGREARRPLARVEMSLSSSGELHPSTSPGKRREIRQARTPLDSLTIRQGSTEIRVPLTRISLLLFTRRAITNSPLPPYVAPEHARHAATVILTDGSRIEGDYINLGFTVLRGTTSEGRVEIPWNEIEAIRFLR